MIIVSLKEKVEGFLMSQSPETVTCSASPPEYFSPTPQPFSTTSSPSVHAECFDSITTPEKSMPGVNGKLRTTGARPVIANASL